MSLVIKLQAHRNGLPYDPETGNIYVANVTVKRNGDSKQSSVGRWQSRFGDRYAVVTREAPQNQGIPLRAVERRSADCAEASSGSGGGEGPHQNQQTMAEECRDEKCLTFYSD